MNLSALFFPYINLPNDSWSTKALLYWDSVSSIVPMQHLKRPAQMSEFMRGLLSEGLVRPVIPAHHLHKIPYFSERFIDLVQAKLDRPHRFNMADRQFSTMRINAEKLHGVTDFLIDTGLAVKVNAGWFDVRSDIAQQFMFYLATCLGAVGDVSAVPVTNSILHFSSFSPRVRGQVNPVHRYKAREVALHNLLPTPAEPITIDQLLLFRRRHGHLLPRLRCHVEMHCINIANISDPDLRIECTNSFLQGCNDQLAEIASAMKPNFGKIIFTSLLPLFGSGLAYPAIGSASVYAGGALSVLSAIYQTIATIREPRIDADRLPLAYIAHAQRTFMF